MKNSPDDSGSTPARKSADDDQFRAVVKRLLDTPPMHKSAATPKQAGKARQAARPKPKG